MRQRKFYFLLTIWIWVAYTWNGINPQNTWRIYTNIHITTKSSNCCSLTKMQDRYPTLRSRECKLIFFHPTYMFSCGSNREYHYMHILHVYYWFSWSAILYYLLPVRKNDEVFECHPRKIKYIPLSLPLVPSCNVSETNFDFHLQL